jgi:hypothetical protein
MEETMQHFCKLTLLPFTTATAAAPADPPQKLITQCLRRAPKHFAPELPLLIALLALTSTLLLLPLLLLLLPLLLLLLPNCKPL